MSAHFVRYTTPIDEEYVHFVNAKKNETMPDVTQASSVEANFPITIIGKDENDQSWFWTEEWQAKELEADEALNRGDYEEFDDIDSFLESL